MRKTFLPFARPDIGQEEISRVKEVLESGWLASGPMNAKLEQAFRDYIGCRHAIAVNSGTSGLFLALRALGIEKGEVITPSMSFVATSNVIVENGLMPCFVDIQRKTLNIDEGLIRSGKATKAIMPVHFNGLVCEMDTINEKASAAGIAVIEDAAHAIGAAHNGKKVGNLSDVTVFSLHPNKNITAGEGGIITTDDDELAARLKELRYFGFLSYQEGSITKYKQEMQRMSLKFNMPDIQAAIALEQLKKVERFTTKRKRLVQAYEELLTEQFCKKNCISKPLQFLDTERHVHHMYQIFVENREKVIEKMRAQNIGVGVHYTPIHLQPYYQKAKCWKALSPLTETEWAGKRTITLPLFTKMTEEDVQDVVEALKVAL